MPLNDNPPILAVRMTDDGNTAFDLRPTNLPPSGYGTILAVLAMHIASMIEIETGYDRNIALDELMKALIDEASSPTATTELRMMQ